MYKYIGAYKCRRLSAWVKHMCFEGHVCMRGWGDTGGYTQMQPNRRPSRRRTRVTWKGPFIATLCANDMNEKCSECTVCGVWLTKISQSFCVMDAVNSILAMNEMWVLRDKLFMQF